MFNYASGYYDYASEPFYIGYFDKIILGTSRLPIFKSNLTTSVCDQLNSLSILRVARPALAYMGFSLT